MKCLEVKRHVSGTVQEKMCRERDQKKKKGIIANKLKGKLVEN